MVTKHSMSCKSTLGKKKEAKSRSRYFLLSLSKLYSSPGNRKWKDGRSPFSLAMIMPDDDQVGCVRWMGFSSVSLWEYLRTRNNKGKVSRSGGEGRRKEQENLNLISKGKLVEVTARNRFFPRVERRFLNFLKEVENVFRYLLSKFQKNTKTLEIRFPLRTSNLSSSENLDGLVIEKG